MIPAKSKSFHFLTSGLSQKGKTGYLNFITSVTLLKNSNLIQRFLKQEKAIFYDIILLFRILKKMNYFLYLLLGNNLYSRCMLVKTRIAHFMSQFF